MDYALELEIIRGIYGSKTSFNPCFSGLCFGATTLTNILLSLICFNPCFSGLCFGAYQAENTYVIVYQF